MTVTPHQCNVPAKSQKRSNNASEACLFLYMVVLLIVIIDMPIIIITRIIYLLNSRSNSSKIPYMLTYRYLGSYLGTIRIT